MRQVLRWVAESGGDRELRQVDRQEANVPGFFFESPISSQIETQRLSISFECLVYLKHVPG